MTTIFVAVCAALLSLLLFVGDAFAHNVSREDIQLISGTSGWNFGLFVWLGAKHMVTGYDHLLFLTGVIFYLNRLRTVAVFVSLFALGHSVTLIAGVALNLQVNPNLVDAIIGLSVAYKGLDNIGGFQTLFGEAPNEYLAVFIFGLFHGLGLATKLQELGLHDDGLIANLISFNFGVEIGQLTALVALLLVLRTIPGRTRGTTVGTVVNLGLILAGFTLMAYQLFLYVG